MENLDIDGLFWLPSNPEDKVAGRLTFDVTDLGQLDLIGTLHELPSSGTVGLLGSPDGNRKYRIHGVAGNRLITLDRCMQVQGKFEVPGVRRERYFAPLVLSGKYFSEDEPLEFSSVSVQLRHLEHWVNVSGINVEYEQGEGPHEIKQVQLTHTPLESLVATTSIGELELRFGWKLDCDYIVRSTIEQSCGFTLKFSESHTLEGVLQTCSALQDLVTVGIFAPSRITRLTLGLPESDVDVVSKMKEQMPVQLYTGLKGSNLPDREKSPIPPEMLFTFDDIGGLDGVAKWVGAANKYRMVIGTLMNYWYAPEQTEESKFFNVITAAEALARIRVQQQNINFGRELKLLACNAGHAFKALVGDVDSWVNEVVRIRNNNVVHSGLRGYADGFKLFDLSESVYFLVVLCLLRECNVSAGTLAGVQRHQRFARLARQLQGNS